MADLITALAALLWPLLLLALLLFARRPLSRVIDSFSTTGGSIRIGEFELSLPQVAQQQQVSISDLQAQVSELKAEVMKLTETAQIAQGPVIGTPAAPNGKRILWVDDHPENNGSLQSALMDQGYEVINALTSAAALSQFDTTSFDFVISDLVRGMDRNAGLHIARDVKARKPHQLVAIYCGAANAERLGGKEKDLGVDLITASPIELMAFLKTSPAGAP